MIKTHLYYIIAMYILYFAVLACSTTPKPKNCKPINGEIKGVPYSGQWCEVEK